MSGYKAAGVEDDRVAMAARRIVRQYHLQQSDRSEESVGAPAARPTGAPDDVHGLRLAVDEMGLAIEHLQRLMANREAVFMATLERIDRNLAKTDGRLDALAMQVARIDARPAIDTDALVEEQRGAMLAVMQEYGGMLALGRALLDEVREVHAAAVPPAPGGGAERPVTR